MTVVTDFYQFKYSRSSYYIDLLINRGALASIEEALDERLSNLSLTKDSECAYMRLKEQFQNSRVATDLPYVDVRINKCYVKYIKNLYEYFMNRCEYASLKALNEYLYLFLATDTDNISTFSILNEDTKVRVLSNI